MRNVMVEKMTTTLLNINYKTPFKNWIIKFDLVRSVEIVSQHFYTVFKSIIFYHRILLKIIELVSQNSNGFG